jgi:uncharacterized protein YndB with AHSA1/START domain
MTINQEKVTIEVDVNAPMEKVWQYFNDPNHVVMWNNASEDWHTPKAENNVVTGGTFNYRMEARDGSSGFDFNGVYDEVVPNQLIRYTMEGGRKVEVVFSEKEGGVHIVETFDSETENPIEKQREGWQSILNNFKKYVEAH